jgi:hypothetical protein
MDKDDDEGDFKAVCSTARKRIRWQLSKTWAARREARENAAPVKKKAIILGI